MPLKRPDYTAFSIAVLSNRQQDKLNSASGSGCTCQQ
jgi:hypothetical protein